MIRPSAFSAPGRFFRGNIHTHSTLSDGALSPEDVCARYAAEGYDFICLSEHFVGLFDNRPTRGALETGNQADPAILSFVGGIVQSLFVLFVSRTELHDRFSRVRERLNLLECEPLRRTGRSQNTSRSVR